MTIFLLVGLSGVDALEVDIKTLYPNDSLKISQDAWLISAKGTSKDISDALHITEGENGKTAVIVASGGYFGRANPAYWEWITAKLKPVSG